MWFAGVDWSDTHHDALVLDEAGLQIGVRRVTHSPEGFRDLINFLGSITGPDKKAAMACIIETNHGLLIAALLEAGFAVYPVNPKTVDRRRSAAGAKTDKIDAYLLAKHGRSESADLRRLEPDSALIAEMKALTRDQDSLIQSHTRLINQLTACLKAYYPVALQLFSKLQQKSTLVFLQTYPTPQVAMAATVDQVAELLKSTRHPTPDKVAAKIVAALHQPHLVADAITTRTKSRLMLVLVKQLLPRLQEMAAYDEVIDELFLTHADSPIFRSLPRAHGMRNEMTILSELHCVPTKWPILIVQVHNRLLPFIWKDGEPFQFNYLG
jgi:transposase